jgi:hypothetical protein
MSAAPGRTVDTWCPRCDDLAAAAPGTPCATCAAPRILIEPPRAPRPPAGRSLHAAGGTPPGGAGRSRDGAGPRGTAAAHGGELASPSPAVVTAQPAGGPRAAGARPAAPVNGGAAPPSGGAAGDGVAWESGTAGRGAAAGHGGSGREPARPSRWLVVGVLGVGVVMLGLGRLLPLVPMGAPPARASSTAGGPRPRPPLVVLPTARPRVVLPARGPMLGRGASGWMVVEYDGWLWRQPLGGGAPHPVARLPQSASKVALSPRGDRVVLVRSGQQHSWQTRVEVRSLVGGVLEEGAIGFGPSWGPGGQLAFVAVAAEGQVGVPPGQNRHPTGPELHLVGESKVDVLTLPGGMHGVKLGWTGDGHPVLLPQDALRSGLFDVERGHLRRVLPAGHGALASGPAGALTTGLLRPRDAAGPLGGALASVPSSLAALAPEGRRVALVTGPAERPRLEVRAAGRRTTSGLPADRYRSVHWSPGGDFVWLESEQAVIAVEVVSGRVVPAGPALPEGAELLGFTS